MANLNQKKIFVIIFVIAVELILIDMVIIGKIELEVMYQMKPYVKIAVNVYVKIVVNFVIIVIYIYAHAHVIVVIN